MIDTWVEREKGRTDIPKRGDWDAVLSQQVEDDTKSKFLYSLLTTLTTKLSYDRNHQHFFLLFQVDLKNWSHNCILREGLSVCVKCILKMAIGMGSIPGNLLPNKDQEGI